jgi:hypothetical protein
MGIEPTTPCLQSRCSANGATSPSYTDLAGSGVVDVSEGTRPGLQWFGGCRPSTTERRQVLTVGLAMDRVTGSGRHLQLRFADRQSHRRTAYRISSDLEGR